MPANDDSALGEIAGDTKDAPREIWTTMRGCSGGCYLNHNPRQIEGTPYILKSEYDSLKDKLEIARKAFQRLIDNLDEGDFISSTRIDEAREALAQIGEG